LSLIVAFAKGQKKQAFTTDTVAGQEPAMAKNYKKEKKLHVRSIR